MSPEDADAVFDAVWEEYQARGAQMPHAGSLGIDGAASPHAAGSAAPRSLSAGGRRGRSPERDQHGRSEPPDSRRALSTSDTDEVRSLQAQVAAAAMLRAPTAAESPHAAAFRGRPPTADAIMQYWSENGDQLARNISSWNSTDPDLNFTTYSQERFKLIERTATSNGMIDAEWQLRQTCYTLIDHNQAAKQLLQTFAINSDINKPMLRILLTAETCEHFVKHKTLARMYSYV
jgi:hypothetical protein